MTDAIQTEVDRNYDFFQRNLSGYLGEHAGEFALLKSAKVIDFFEGPGDAYREGLRRFSDGLFSIQPVTNEPVELGFFSVGIA
jgi:hypothetical protein